MLKFPQILEVDIRNFSLYTKKNHIKVRLDNGVLCLAGANGLGKSTFISIVNYALTGIVVDTSKNFSSKNSIPKFYTDNKRFAADYFKGRIVDKDIELAEVSIKFVVNSHEYHITRGFFEQDLLRSYSRRSPSDKEVEVGDNPTRNNQKYMQQLSLDMDLSSFDQFVFLQYFLFTFDESRQLLFWDSTIMERVLHLFFGIDSERASQADQLRKDVTRLGSNARNLRWDITQLYREINKLQAVLNGGTVVIEDDIIEQYQELEQNTDDLINEINNLNRDAHESEVLISATSFDITNLKSEYNNLFSDRYQKKSSIIGNPIIINSINESTCQLCHSSDKRAITNIKSLHDSENCPLCKSKINHLENNGIDIEDLKKIDKIIIEKNKELESIVSRKNNISHRLRIAQDELISNKRSIEEFQSIYPDLTSFNSRESIAERSSLKMMFEQVANLEKQKDEDSAKRDIKQKQLKELERALGKAYTLAQAKFLPTFIGYAHTFIGLDLDINLNITSKGVGLALDVNNTARKDQYQLSESQRYFLDIALRMALIEYSNQQACLLIDTPEGSLDIAYESRAGRMFADFAKENHSIIMTANINSSQLLLQLARKCGRERMSLIRMTSWSTLTEVQNEEIASIDAAYEAIEKQLIHVS